MRSRMAAVGIATAALAVAGATGLPATAAPSGASTADATSVYVVVLRPAPLATFAGNASFEATIPRDGARFDARRPAVAAYAARLDRLQEHVVAALGEPDVVYSYTTAIDGFAALLTPAQAQLAATQPAVASVQAARIDRLDGAPSAARSAASSFSLRPPEAAGRGVVIGVVDSGVWPENPSFAAPPLDRSSQRARYPGFTGHCEDSGEQWSPTLCNAKLIAARSYVEGFGADRVSAAEYLSPRDGSGHGSHVAATAAGDAGVDVRIDRQDFGRRTGAAPAAGLAVYKACWAAPDPADDGCSTADVLAAVDQAVHDGVDVLNYAASNPADPSDASDDPLERAFANAAAAGVFVATSAGDHGPQPGTLAHGAPWVTTVAAVAEPTFQGGVRLGSGDEIFGSMASDRPVRSARLVFGGDVPARGATNRAARLCEPGSLDAARVDNAIVLCERGATARVSKSAEVARAGGLAMILANTAPGATSADVHAVPTVHVDARSGAELRHYIATTSRPTASFDPAAVNPSAAAHIAAFSGRGPVIADNGAVLMPDVSAPGTNVVSAVAPPFNFGRLWDIYSGTSMAVPQVAGLAADVVSRHPDWSPAAIKSAIVTTARPIASGAGAFAAGAGAIDPARASDPGIVYDTGPRRWANTPSLSVGSLTGTATVTRHVTGVASAPETYTATVTGLPGVAARVTPSTLRVSPGSTERFRVILSAQRSAHYGDFVTGQLTWSGSLGHVATSPIVVRPESIAAPVDVRGFGAAGEASLRPTAGVTGTMRTRIVGPVAATPAPLLLTPGGFDPAAPDSSAATAQKLFYVPAHAVAARFATDLVAGGDTDLYVYRGQRLIAQASSPQAAEELTVRRPLPGLYTVYINAPELGPGNVVAARFTGWVLSSDSAFVPSGSGLAVNPPQAAVTGGEPVDLQLRWSGLDSSQRWLAAVRYRGSDAITYVTVN
ncbi:MAG TPA: S8 family serine peptidase [Nocardioidaceae bacterium]|nr:S8 family serine peptidase [Nocardioidaceae bacterium]